MKKFLCTMVMGVGILFQVDASLDIKDYLTYVNKAGDSESDNFGNNVDLARGMILLTRGCLSEQRHFGNMEFSLINDKKANACSKFDKSNDPMTQLLIFTQPSVGSDDLNAVGTGSLEEKLSIFLPVKELEAGKTDSLKEKFGAQIRGEKISKFFVAEVISDMFNLANNVRKTVLENHKNNVAALKTGIDIFEIIDKIDNEAVKISDTNEDLSQKRKKILDVIITTVSEYKKVIDGANNAQLSKNFEKTISELEKNKNANFNLVKKQITWLISCMEAKKIKKAIADLGQKEVTFESISEKLNGQLNDLSRFVGKSSKKNTQLDPVSVKLFNDFAQKYFKNYYAAVGKLEQEVGKDLEARKKLENFEFLFELGKSIAGAVLQERFVDEDDVDFNVKWNERPYFPQYTNDIIAAYACSVIGSEELAPLAKMIEDKGGKLDKDLIDSLAKEESVVRLVPFSANRKIPSYGTAHYGRYVFSDCVETTLRQFFSTLFATRTENGALKTDLSRIPDSSTLLKQFFKTYEEKMGIENLANSEDSQVRDDWASICSGHVDEKVLYKQDGGNGYETKSNWGNIIKQICIIMKDYPAMLNEKLRSTGSTIEDDSDTNLENGEVVSRRQKAAARQIVEVLNKLHSDEFSVTTPLVNSSDEVIAILNNLLGIRTDVELVAEEPSEEALEKYRLSKLELDDDHVYGTVNIYIKDQPRKVNELFFVAGDGHAFLQPIPLEKKTAVNYSSEDFKLPSMAQLYKLGEELTVTARSNCSSLGEAKYPVLDFFRTIKSDETLGNALTDILDLDKKAVYKSAVNRLIRHWNVWHFSIADFERIVGNIMRRLSNCKENEAIEKLNMLSNKESQELTGESLAVLYYELIFYYSQHPLTREILNRIKHFWDNDHSNKISAIGSIGLMHALPNKISEILDRVDWTNEDASLWLGALCKRGPEPNKVLNWFLQKYYPDGAKIPTDVSFLLIKHQVMPIVDVLEKSDLLVDSKLSVDKLNDVIFGDTALEATKWILQTYYPGDKKIPVDIATLLVSAVPSVSEFLQRVDFKNTQPTYEEIEHFSETFERLDLLVCEKIAKGILQYYKNNKIKVPMSFLSCVGRKMLANFSDLLTYGVDFEGREPTQKDIKVLKKLAPEIVDKLLSAQS